MAAQQLELGRHRPDWHVAAHAGRLVRPGCEARPVLVVLGAPVADAEVTAERARAAASALLGWAPPGVLELLDVLPFEDRTAWVYSDIEALGVGHLVGGGELLPIGAAAELVAEVAALLISVGTRGLAHPGPEPHDVLLHSSGRVSVGGFVSPFPASPAMREPGGREDAPALVWRLGVLFAALTSGSAPPPCSDRSAHEASLRRVLIRTMSRPGPVPPTRLRHWMEHLLAWDSGARPPLSTVEGALRQLAADTREPGLEAWCAVHLVSRRLDALAGPPELAVEADTGPTDLGDADPPDALPSDEHTRPGMSTLAGFAPPRREEDQTMESIGTTSTDTTLPHTVPPERGAIPVAVGPPAEAVPSARVPRSVIEALESGAITRREGWSWQWWFLGASALLLALGIALAVYVF